MQAASLIMDRMLQVPPGHTVKTGYLAIHRVMMACRERMAAGDIDNSLRFRLSMGPAQPYPLPFGSFCRDTAGVPYFLLQDGRHDYIAAQMLGFDWYLVAWMEPLYGGESDELRELREQELLRY